MIQTAERWYHSEDDRIVCELCPRACRMKDGDRGFCFVRKNVDGRMVLDTYGKSTGFCIDPIEKKPLSHFLPGTPVLSFGTAGCNLGCKFCQNWDISKSREVSRLSDRAMPHDIALGGEGQWLSKRGLYLQRPGHLGRIRDRHRACLSRNGDQVGGGHRGLHHRAGSWRFLSRDGCRQH